MDLPLSGRGEWCCRHTGDIYVVDGEDVTRHPGSHDILKYVAGERLQRMEVKT